MAATILSVCSSSAEEQQNPESAEEHAQEALATLEAAIDKGYNNLAELEHNPELDVLRDRPEFSRLVSRLETHRVR